ncbi:MarR family transcriptional regulator [Streptomyces sp. S3(2020)]|uniref:MarR family winged helix-turn-helix transcriptional regulator n=1 Tax=Streptomyces sp. S3(2020) TaxID=2732044 RepID=UPI0014892C24|nr:MarR family transcriptional regulator [Streptomyces sp. S3(2020)]NNN30607.1 MarR family transcriptional regulator [Streptomyces sp. S3(2020)]
MDENRPLDAAQEHAWLALLKGHPLLVNHLDAGLRERSNLSLIDYGILAELAQTPERRLLMAALARSVVYSRSGLTRLVDGLESRGLVIRERLATDRRSWYVILTDEGLTALEQARPHYLADVSDHFVSLITPEQVKAIASAFGAVIADLAPDHEELRKYHPDSENSP